MAELMKITNVLIFKDGVYWLTKVHIVVGELNYEIAKEKDFPEGKYRNGFEFAPDAYAYLNHLQAGG